MYSHIYSNVRSFSRDTVLPTLYILGLVSFLAVPQRATAQGDLLGSIVIGPYPMEEFNPEFIYRGAQTTHPLHNWEFYGVSPLDHPHVLDAAQNSSGLRRTINHLTRLRAPFILTEGFLPTNLHFRTEAFDYGLLDIDGLRCEDCWTYEQLQAIDDPDYWQTIRQLYDRGYRPVIRHNFKDLAERSLVMQHVSAPPPGTGQPATYIDGNRVGRSSVAGGLVHRIDDSYYFANIDPEILDRVPTYESYMFEMTTPVFDEVPSELADSLSKIIANEEKTGWRQNPGSITESTPPGTDYMPLDDPVDFDLTTKPTPEPLGQTPAANAPPADPVVPDAPVSDVPVSDATPSNATPPDTPLETRPARKTPVEVDPARVTAKGPAKIDKAISLGASQGAKGASAASVYGPLRPTDPGYIVVSHHPDGPERVRVKKFPVNERLKLVSPKTKLRYQSVCNAMRRSLLRAAVSSNLQGGGRLLRGIGAGLVVQYGASEGLKAMTSMDDDTANMVVMPLSEAVGMVAFDLALPTVAAATGTAAATSTVATTAVAAAVGGLAVVTEGTRRSADQLSLKLAYDNNSMEMGTSMTINLMRRNAHLRDTGEISQEEMMRRNKALGDSARKEGDRTVKEAQWIDERYTDGFTACFGNIVDGLIYRTGLGEN